jgi:hypothetical protein
MGIDGWGGGRLINVASRPSLNIFSQGQPLKGPPKAEALASKKPSQEGEGVSAVRGG